MPEFLRLSPPAEALQTLLSALQKQVLNSEIINTTNALGRVTAEEVRAPHPLPEFPRSTVDGYAVRARDTYGMSESLPGYLSLIGEVPMGTTPAFELKPGECALIHTGGMLPAGANAVVMLEYTQAIVRGAKLANSPSEIETTRATAEGENVLRIGEDVTMDQVVLEAGVRLRPAEIGGCMALGIVKLRVVIKPRIGIISSGDEVVSPEKSPRPGQIRDINSYSLAALVETAGGEPVLYGIVSDSLDLMKTTARRALDECKAVVITAGSSASARDITAEAIAALGAPGVLVHGINIRPGKPTILAVCNEKAIIGLPGNPAGALVIAGLFVVPVIERLLGLKVRHPRPSVQAKLTINVSSQAGREDWIAVKLITISHSPSNQAAEQRLEEGNWVAEPIFGKSNLIFTLASADGLVRIPMDATGVSAGDVVEVVLM